MKSDDWLQQASAKLSTAGIITARLECLVLLEDDSCKDRSWLLAHPDYSVKGPSLHKLNEQIDRRARHEPLAYIRGKTEFYGREFLVNANTLEPRPETETMIEHLKQLVYSRQLTVNSQLQIADIGTGSGCLAVTAKLEIPDSNVIAIDISSDCLKIARGNAKKYNIDIEFFNGDLLEPLYRLPSTVYCLLVNLPYVPNSHTINQAAMFEPRLAIFGGPDGLDLYRKFFQQINSLPNKPHFVLTESLPSQHKTLASIANQHGFVLLKTDDFIQVYS